MFVHVTFMVLFQLPEEEWLAANLLC